MGCIPSQKLNTSAHNINTAVPDTNVEEPHLIHPIVEETKTTPLIVQPIQSAQPVNPVQQNHHIRIMSLNTDTTLMQRPNNNNRPHNPAMTLNSPNSNHTQVLFVLPRSHYEGNIILRKFY